MERLLDFEKERTKFEKVLKTAKFMVLATSKDNRVTARTMSVVSIGTKVYFQTSLGMCKMDQISANPNVALCFGSHQIEGKAMVLGTWSHNPDILEAYRIHHESSYETYKNLDDEIAVEVEITLVKQWEYRERIPFLCCIDLIEKRAWEEEFDV